MARFQKFVVHVGITLMGLLLSSPAFAQAAEHAAGGKDSRDAMLAIAAGLAIGIAAFGGALGQSRAASTALDGIARNPGASGKIFTPMLLGLALIETLVLFAFLIAFFLQGNIGK